MANPFEVKFVDPVLGALSVERELAGLAAQRDARLASELAYQEAGLRLQENLANAPVREAERAWKLGGMRELEQQFRTGVGEMPGAAPAAGAGAKLPGTAGFIAGFEGFSPTPYEDMTVRNGQRVSAGIRGGFGSDTVTLANGTVVRVTPGMTISEADAVRDLQRRIETEFQPRAVQAVGSTAWSALPSQAHDALVSIAYNYGDVTRAAGVAEAAKSGNLERLAAAIEARAGDNGGINRQRRLAEAAHVRSALTAQQGPQQGPQQPVPPAPMMTMAPGLSPAAPAAPAFQAPSMMSTPGAGMRLSSGGVPMTVADANLPALGANEAQATFQVPGPNGMQTVTMPAQGGAAPAAGAPQAGTEVERATRARADVEAQRQRELLVQNAQTRVYQSPEGQAAVQLMEQGRLRGDREMYQRGQAAFTQLVDRMYTVLGDAGLPVPAAGPAPTPTTATPTATQPTSAVPFTPTTGEAISQLPAATSLAGLGITPIGGGAAAQQPAAGAQPRGPAPAAQPTGIAGLELVGSAKQDLQQIDQQRALLQRRMALARTLSPAEAAKELVAIQTDSIALNRRAVELRGDQAIGQMTMGQPQALDAIFQQNYNLRLRPITTGTQVTGYDILGADGTVRAQNVSPAALGRQARLAINQTYAKQEAEAAMPFRKAQVEAWLDSQKELNRATADIAIEKIKASFPDLKITKGEGPDTFVITDRGAAFIVSKTKLGPDGKPLSNGETRWTTEPIQYGAVSIR